MKKVEFEFPSIFTFDTKKYGKITFCLIDALHMYFYYDVKLNLFVGDAFKKFIKLKEIKANKQIMYFKDANVYTRYGACCGLGIAEYKDNSFY